MKFKNVLNELSAEIVNNGIIPLQRIYIDKVVPKKLPPEWGSVLRAIKAKLVKLNLIDSFSKDAKPLDIFGHQPKGNIKLQADDGTNYIYNVENDMLYGSDKKKIG